MTPLRKPFALVTLLAVMAAACSSSPQLIATVGTDVKITTEDIASLYESESLPIDSTLRGAIFAMAAREVIKATAFAELGVTIDSTKVDELFRDMVLDRDSRGETTADWLGVPDAGDGLMIFNAEIAVLRDQVIRALVTDPEYLDELFANPVPITQVCVKHILVATEIDAQDVILQLLGGADFADLAAAVSIDSANGGDLGCRGAAEYVAEFAAATIEAPLDEVFGPVQSEFGFHVLIVSERTAPTRDEVIADPITHISPGTADTVWEEWVSAALNAAEVTVEPEFGTWSPTGIIPPIE